MLNRIFNILWLLSVLVFVTASNASAQSQISRNYINSDASFGLVSSVKIGISDNVSGKCWTNPENISSTMRLKFEQNDVETLQYKPNYSDLPHPAVLISAIGFRLKNGLCSVYAHFVVSYVNFTFFNGADNGQKYSVPNFSVLFEKGSLFTSGSNLNDELRDFFDASSSLFVAQILSGRRNSLVKAVKQDYPKVFEKPISVEAYNTLVKNIK